MGKTVGQVVKNTIYLLHEHFYVGFLVKCILCFNLEVE